VIFQENRSFDHYFGTYPHAKANKDGSKFFGGAKDGTPRVNDLESAGLLTNNPNKANLFRIDRSTPNNCDENHGYSAEQAAFHGGLMDMFVQQRQLNQSFVVAISTAQHMSNADFAKPEKKLGPDANDGDVVYLW
jgi:phospholipase C